jgi:hypothetical protein
MGREEDWGSQLGVASWGSLQSPFYIVCLNQGHFFLSLFSSISMISFEFFSSKYHRDRGRVGWQAGGGQRGLAAVSLLHSLSYSRPLFSKSFFTNFYDFF